MQGNTKMKDDIIELIEKELKKALHEYNNSAQTDTADKKITISEDQLMRIWKIFKEGPYFNSTEEKFQTQQYTAASDIKDEIQKILKEKNA